MNHPTLARRTVVDLLAEAAQRREDRRLRAVAKRAAGAERLEHARELAYERRLARLATAQEDAWTQVDELIATRKPNEYNRAIDLLTDLETLAKRNDLVGTFSTRVQVLRRTHARKTRLIERLNRAGL